MISRGQLSGLVLGILISLFLRSPIHPQSPPPNNSTAAYPNDSEGLRRLLNDMLEAARRKDLLKLRSMIHETEIPNYEDWYIANFGQEKGESWATPYGRWLEEHEREFQKLLIQLAQMDGDFAIEKCAAQRGTTCLRARSMSTSQ